MLWSMGLQCLIPLKSFFAENNPPCLTATYQWADLGRSWWQHWSFLSQPQQIHSTDVCLNKTYKTVAAMHPAKSIPYSDYRSQIALLSLSSFLPSWWAGGYGTGVHSHAASNKANPTGNKEQGRHPLSYTTQMCLREQFGFWPVSLYF